MTNTSREIDMTSSAPVEIEYRPAVRSDSLDIARFMCMAGGGLYEFLFDDLVPFLDAADILGMGIAQDDYPISFENCIVAVDPRSGDVVGAANLFAADLLKDQDYRLVPADRQEHVRKVLALQDWGSMFLNALAVSDTHRQNGVGRRLLAMAEEQASAGGFDRLSLHVWASNVTAVDFYARHGFVEIGVAPVAAHPRLSHADQSLLMRHSFATTGHP
jgi:ribosomal protein S18 acetylase RimI-like enzyme